MLANLKIVPSTEARNELLAWLNTTMPTTAPNGVNVAPMHKVEQCGNGIPYVLMLPNMLPISYPPLTSATRVKVPANHDFEAVANIKLIQDALHRNGVNRPDVLMNEVSKILKGNFQANLQLLQWFKGFYDALTREGIESANVSKLAIMPPLNSSVSSTSPSPPAGSSLHPLRSSTMQQQQQPLLTSSEIELQLSPDVNVTLCNSTTQDPNGANNSYSYANEPEVMEMNENDQNEKASHSYKTRSMTYHGTNRKTGLARKKALSMANNYHVSNNSVGANKANSTNRRCTSEIQYRSKPGVHKVIQQQKQVQQTQLAKAKDTQSLALEHKQVIEQGNAAAAQAIALLNSNESTAHEVKRSASLASTPSLSETTATANKGGAELAQNGRRSSIRSSTSSHYTNLSTSNSARKFDPMTGQPINTTHTKPTISCKETYCLIKEEEEPEYEENKVNLPVTEDKESDPEVSTLQQSTNSQVRTKRQPSQTLTVLKSPTSTCSRVNSRINSASRFSLTNSIRSTLSSHAEVNKQLDMHTTANTPNNKNVESNVNRPVTQHRSSSVGVSKVSRHISTAPSGSFVSTVSSVGHSFLQSANKTNINKEVNSTTYSSTTSSLRRAQSMGVSTPSPNPKNNNINKNNNLNKTKPRTSATGAPAVLLGVDKGQRKTGFANTPTSATNNNNGVRNGRGMSSNPSHSRNVRSMSSVNYGRGTRMNKLATTTHNNVGLLSANGSTVSSSSSTAAAAAASSSRRPYSAARVTGTTPTKDLYLSRERSPSLHNTPAETTGATASVNITTEGSRSQTNNNNNKSMLNEEVEMVVLERQFFYDKLRLIEDVVRPLTERVLSDDVKTTQMARKILEILYATAEASL